MTPHNRLNLECLVIKRMVIIDPEKRIKLVSQVIDIQYTCIALQVILAHMMPLRFLCRHHLPHLKSQQKKSLISFVDTLNR